MGPTTMSLLLLAGFVAVALCAPTLKESPSNKVIVDDDEFLSQDERERVVAGIILQIARDFDEGFITQDELEGRSALRQDTADDARKGKKESQATQKASDDKMTQIT